MMRFAPICRKAYLSNQKVESDRKAKQNPFHDQTAIRVKPDYVGRIHGQLSEKIIGS